MSEDGTVTTGDDGQHVCEKCGYGKLTRVPTQPRVTEAMGPFRALLDALRKKKPLVWNGDVLLVFEYDVPDSDLWTAQASMVLDADDFAALEAALETTRKDG